MPCDLCELLDRNLHYTVQLGRQLLENGQVDHETATVVDQAAQRLAERAEVYGHVPNHWRVGNVPEAVRGAEFARAAAMVRDELQGFGCGCLERDRQVSSCWVVDDLGVFPNELARVKAHAALEQWDCDPEWEELGVPIDLAPTAKYEHWRAAQASVPGGL